MSAPPPGRPAPEDALDEIRAAHVRGPNGWCDEDVQDWPCDVADLLEDRDALAARLADAEAALWNLREAANEAQAILIRLYSRDRLVAATSRSLLCQADGILRSALTGCRRRDEHGGGEGELG